MQVENTQEDFEIVSTIAIYPWCPLSIRRNLSPQSQNHHLPFKANALKKSRKYKFWLTRQHSTATRRNGLPHMHTDVRDHIRAVGMNDFYLISDNSAMGIPTIKMPIECRK